MLHLSALENVPLYENDYTQVISSYSMARHIGLVPDQGCSALGGGYAIAGLVDITYRKDTIPMAGHMVDARALYDGMPDAVVNGAPFRPLLEGMQTRGYRFGGAHLFTHGYVYIPDTTLLKRYLIKKGPALLTVAGYSAAGAEFWVPRGERLGYHPLIAVGYNARGIEVVGTRGISWGNCGMRILPWADFPQVKEMWGILI